MAFIITPQYGVWPYHSDGVAPSPTICYRTTMRGWCMTWHLSSRHNMGCDHTIPMVLRHHTPLLSHHNAEGNHTIPWGCATTALYYHIITRRVITPFRWDCTITPLYYHIITRRVTIPFRWCCAITALYYHIITWRVITPFRWGKACHQR